MPEVLKIRLFFADKIFNSLKDINPSPVAFVIPCLFSIWEIVTKSAYF
jgi:hypothetical protein